MRGANSAGFSEEDLDRLIREDSTRKPIMSEKTLEGVIDKICKDRVLSRLKPIRGRRCYEESESREISSEILNKQQCYDVSERVAQIINNPETHLPAQSYHCSKIFAYGDNKIQPTKKKITWDNHLAVLVKLEGAKYPANMVIDPMMDLKPIHIDDWIQRLTNQVKRKFREDGSKEVILSYLIFPSFFLRPNYLQYAQIYSNFMPVKGAKPKDFINPNPII